MAKFDNYLKMLDPTSQVTEEEIARAEALLRSYGPTLKRAGWRIEEMEETCYESRRQSISDFIDLAIDYDHDADRKRIVERLYEMGHTMQLLEIMDEALVMVRSEPKHGVIYYKILQTRFFDAYCTTNEEAFLRLGISSATYYRHFKNAIRAFAANLWCVVIPDLIIASHIEEAELHKLCGAS